MRIKGIILVATLFSVSFFGAEERVITIRAIDGRTGQILANQHLLILGGDNPGAVTYRQQRFELVSDEFGKATLTVPFPQVSWIQVWAEGMTQCQAEPNLHSYSVDWIGSKGLVAPNTCGDVSPAVQPGVFSVFARPSTDAEASSAEATQK